MDTIDQNNVIQDKNIFTPEQNLHASQRKLRHYKNIDTRDTLGRKKCDSGQKYITPEK